MLYDALLNVYTGLLFSLILCYIVYRLNTDLKQPAFFNYVFISVVIASEYALLSIFLPDILLPVKMLIYILSITLILKFSFMYNVYYSTVTAFSSLLIFSLCNMFAYITYFYNIKLDEHSIMWVLFNNTIGKGITFVAAYVILKWLADNFAKARRRIYKKHKKLTIILCVNLINAFVVLIYTFSLLVYIHEFNKINVNNSRIYFSVVFIIVTLLASIFGSVYLINYLLLNKLECDRLKMINIKDIMTGTLNRNSGLKFIEDQLQICKKLKQELTICYIDVNDLKVINDMLGHREGDYLIKTVVSTIKDNIRETDVISRLGGDEFVIVFPGCPIEYAQNVMDRIADILKHLKPFEDKQYTISISYGFSQYNEELDDNADGLLDRADHQMYLNKRAIKAMA